MYTLEVLVANLTGLSVFCLLIKDLSNDGDINEMFCAQIEIDWKENK